MSLFKKLFGPSTLVAAAFIGPGTLTTCTLAGVNTSYELIWVLCFAILATIILQEMAARLGLVTQQGLGEAFNKQFQSGITRFVVFTLVIGAIIVGNAAYEAGNIAGGVLGLNLLAGEFRYWPVVLGSLCFALLFMGKYKWIENLLVAMVVLMSVCFLLTAILVKPNMAEVAQGLIPRMPKGDNLFLAMAVVGTTVVPYNLFLHASTISKKWKRSDSLKELRMENAFSIILGGLISILIIITAASSAGNVTEINSAQDLAVQLEPLVGQQAKWLMGIGLMAAGISSALTAPIAAAYAAKGLFDWKGDENNPKFRAVWLLILGIGILVATLKINLILIIKFAQITNAILLPFVAIYLLYLVNSKKILGKHTNGLLTNLLGLFVILVTLLLSFKSLNNIFHLV